MSALEIGKKLVQFCKEGKNLESINTLYAEDVESVEAAAPPEGERAVKGIEAVRGKNQWWIENHEVHEASVEGPFPHGDEKFAVIFKFDVTNKPSGQRMKMEEVGVFTLKDGKVAKEEF
ncbi:MAG: nuclear transport factor 2 family protein, partial [Myxococcota bacterium]